ncbi:hypothetical protein FIBSPDRAFT_81749 [Athelia psychrophila]|uniref:Uncharacterized protein n=1 Tax=Athelia psychrophila TaxID=1759441 RepID=A0A166E618_9AGAM|nr:hypothetical protein FIBSPDRAFT_81749 [Fibularhizoctonia sp. CBS 109695]
MNRRNGIELTFSIAFQDSNIYPLLSSLERSETPCADKPASANTIMDSDEHSNTVPPDQHLLVQDDNSIGRRQREEEIGLAEKSIAKLQLAPPITDKIERAVGGSAEFTDTFSPIAVSLSALLDKIKPFVDIADQLAEIHPYAKMAWSILSLIPKSIIAQRERDESLCNLMETIKDVHIFLAEVEPLEIIDSQRKIAEDIGRLTVESAHLIRHYTVNENFFKRVATLAFSTASAKIQKIQDQLEELKEAFQLRAVAHIEITALQIEITTFQILERTKDIDMDNILREMPYGMGGRYDSGKGCLSGTRTAVLDELHRLINLPDGDGTPRLLVLTGVAGCGKSAIARTMAQHYDGTKRLGSSVFFDQADQQTKCHSSNLLSTVAHDIADLDTRWKTALYEIVKGSHSLRSTSVISDQMASFIIGPAKALSIIGPIVIVIDALDKSGDSKGDLIQSFMERASDLPGNFRILITAPSESGFSNNQHVRIMPLETLGDANIDGDIFKLLQSKLASIADMLERKLASVAYMLPTNSKQWCHALVLASDHSFEWAAAASRAILQGKDDDAQVEILLDIVENKRTLRELPTKIRAGESKQDESKAIPGLKQPCVPPSDQIIPTDLPLTLGCTVAQLPSAPSIPPSDQITTFYPPVDPFFTSKNSAARSILQVMGIVQNMKASQVLSGFSKDLPETLASLERTLELLLRAIQVYQHTSLVQSLSNAISKGVEECRQVLNELQSNLASYRYKLYPFVIHFIQTYIWGGIGQGASVHALDSNLRKCHSSFIACLLALGRAEWPELKRGLGKETLEELELFYEELKRETTSLQHMKVDTIIVLDHLGRSLPIPMIFCISPQDFHIVITGFCRGLAGDFLIRQGNYRILNSEDDQVINPDQFAIALQPGMDVGMSIVFHEQAEERQGIEGYSCPRCHHVNSRCTGWVTCGKCNGSFKISPEEESIVSPETEQRAGTYPIPDERFLFRKISIFQARAQNRGIKLNKLNEMQPEVPQEAAKAREMTKSQPDDAQDMTARPSVTQLPNSRIPRTQGEGALPKDLTSEVKPEEHYSANRAMAPSELPPLSADVLEICPRLRILVVGKERENPP